MNILENDMFYKLFNDQSKKENNQSEEIKQLLKEQNQILNQINFNIIQLTNKLEAPEK